MTMLDAGLNASPLSGSSPVEGRRVLHTDHYNLALVRTVLTPAVIALVGEKSSWPSSRLAAPARTRLPEPTR